MLDQSPGFKILELKSLSKFCMGVSLHPEGSKEVATD